MSRLLGERSKLSLSYLVPRLRGSGFGDAARETVNALRSAELEVNLDPDLATSGIPGAGSSPIAHRSPDFHLLHGVPTRWKTLPNDGIPTIGITACSVSMPPSSYVPILNQLREVWVPSQHNVDAFRKYVAVPVFKLPHPVPQRLETESKTIGLTPAAAADPFVFYSVFVWNRRKGPDILIRSYLSAFRGDDPTVLVIKTNADAANAARTLLNELRRETASSAKVELIAASISEEELTLLHRRGDCYVSMHRGEGWGMPLFEAACRGKIIVASAYSGPADYLSSENHFLVPFVMEPVVGWGRHDPGTLWGEPDAGVASTMLRQAFEHRQHIRDQVFEEGERLRRQFSQENVGSMARSRLLRIQDQETRM